MSLHVNQTLLASVIHFARVAECKRSGANDDSHGPFDIFHDAINTKVYSTEPFRVVCRSSVENTKMYIRKETTLFIFAIVKKITKFHGEFNLFSVPYARMGFVLSHLLRKLKTLLKLIGPKYRFPFFALR